MLELVTAVGHPRKSPLGLILSLVQPQLGHWAGPSPPGTVASTRSAPAQGQ